MDEYEKMKAQKDAMVARDNKKIRDESAWLIEYDRKDGTPLFYYGMSDYDLESSTLSWTQDSLKAIRFSRRQDALTVLNNTRWMNLGHGAVVAEHMWCEPKEST